MPVVEHAERQIVGFFLPSDFRHVHMHTLQPIHGAICLASSQQLPAGVEGSAVFESPLLFGYITGVYIINDTHDPSPILGDSVHSMLSLAAILNLPIARTWSCRTALWLHPTRLRPAPSSAAHHPESGRNGPVTTCRSRSSRRVEDLLHVRLPSDLRRLLLVLVRAVRPSVVPNISEWLVRKRSR